jgi:hypothetical protein
VAISVFDGTGGGIAVGILILLVALGFGAAACMDILMLSKVFIWHLKNVAYCTYI